MDAVVASNAGEMVALADRLEAARVRMNQAFNMGDHTSETRHIGAQDSREDIEQMTTVIIQASEALKMLGHEFKPPNVIDSLLRTKSKNPPPEAIQGMIDQMEFQSEAFMELFQPQAIQAALKADNYSSFSKEMPKTHEFLNAVDGEFSMHDREDFLSNYWPEAQQLEDSGELKQLQSHMPKTFELIAYARASRACSDLVDILESKHKEIVAVMPMLGDEAVVGRA